MESFVAYLDILGTKDLVLRGKFSDAHALDFTGAATGAALQFRASRFAAFSDCVILSVPALHPMDLINILCFLFENWLDDGILVRGGIALGDVRWVDAQRDPLFGQLKNFTFARVYGKALSDAVEIEQSSGPGVLPFAADAVADRLLKTAPDSVLRLSSNVLRWFQWANLDKWIARFQHALDHTDAAQVRRHVCATKRVLDLFRRSKAERTAGQAPGA